MRDDLLLSHLLDGDRIAIDFTPNDKWDAIGSLTHRLASFLPPQWDIGDVVEAIHGRERLLATGLEKGIALPHAMLDGDIATHGVLGIAKTGVDFDCHDGKPARFVLLMVFPDTEEGRNRHVALLGLTIRLLTDDVLRRALESATDAAFVLDQIREAERRLET